MRYSLSTIALTALASSCACVSALEINCLGSSRCEDSVSLPSSFPTNRSIVDFLYREISDYTRDDSVYQNGMRILCVDDDGDWLGSICVSFKGANGNGKMVKILSKMILEHGCKTCGSAPVRFASGLIDGVKPDADGELTFNYVDRYNNDDLRCGDITGGKCYMEVPEGE